jgi:hypothetical protein
MSNTPRDSIALTLEAAIPKSLDDIIRANRDKMRLTLATDSDFLELTKPLDYTGQVRETLSPWYIIVRKVTGHPQVAAQLLGYTQRNLPWITSNIVGVDLDRGLVQTRNSWYGVDVNALGRGEPGAELLATVCAHMRGDGLGDYFQIPPWFF